MHSQGLGRGFTLIELLVVIAIIGILSSVVLGSLNVARAKGADAAIRGDVKQLSSQTNLYYDSHGSYGIDLAVTSCLTAVGTAGTVFNDPVINNQVTDAVAKSGDPSGVTSKCAAGNGTGAPSGVTATSWAISIPLKSNPATSWCLDSQSVSGTGLSATINATTFIADCE